MSIIQALIGSIVSSTSGGGGGGGTYPDPGGASYITQGATTFSSPLGTPYNPGGAVQNIANATAGWLRKTSSGYWCNIGSQANDNPSIFQNPLTQTNDPYGGFGYTSGADTYAMEWTGYFRVPSTASYWTFYTDSDDVAMFWIGNAALNPTLQNAYVVSNNNSAYPSNSLLLTEGSWYPIRMRFQEWDGAERCQVYAAADGGPAYAMISYFNGGHMLYNGVTGGYGSANSLLLSLGDIPFSGSGNWLDNSPALNHAELYGVTTLPTYLPDEAEGVWQLDGTQYFNVPTLANYRESTMTLLVWFNCASDNTFSQNLVSKELSFKLRITPGGVINILAGDGTSWALSYSAASTITYGVWNQIAVTINSSETVVYLNGQVAGNYTGTTIDATSDFPFNIGSHSNGSDNFTGKIGEVTVLSSIFDAGTIASEYTTTAPRYGITP